MIRQLKLAAIINFVQFTKKIYILPAVQYPKSTVHPAPEVLDLLFGCMLFRTVHPDFISLFNIVLLFVGEGPEARVTHERWARPAPPTIDPKKDTLVFQQLDCDTYTGKQATVTRLKLRNEHIGLNCVH